MELEILKDFDIVKSGYQGIGFAEGVMCHWVLIANIEVVISQINPFTNEDLRDKDLTWFYLRNNQKNIFFKVSMVMMGDKRFLEELVTENYKRLSK